MSLKFLKFSVFASCIFILGGIIEPKIVRRADVVANAKTSMQTKGHTSYDGTHRSISDSLGIWVPDKKTLIIYGFQEKLSPQKREEILRDPLVSTGAELIIARNILEFHGKSADLSWNPIFVIQIRIRQDLLSPSDEKQYGAIYLFHPEENEFIGSDIDEIEDRQLIFPNLNSHGSVKFMTEGMYQAKKLKGKVITWNLDIDSEIISVPSLNFSQFLLEE